MDTGQVCRSVDGQVCRRVDGRVYRRVDGHWTGVPEGRWTGVPERVDVCYHLFFRQSLSAVKVYSYPSGLMRGATYQSTDLTLFSLQLLQNMWDIIALIPTIPAFENVKPHCPWVISVPEM